MMKISYMSSTTKMCHCYDNGVKGRDIRSNVQYFYFENCYLTAGLFFFRACGKVPQGKTLCLADPGNKIPRSEVKGYRSEVKLCNRTFGVTVPEETFHLQETLHVK